VTLSFPVPPEIPDPSEKPLLPEIRIGDPIYHGSEASGAVVGGDPPMSISEIGEARVGDACYCDIHDETVIAQMTSVVSADGLPVAKEGDLTECGATLIPTQFYVLTEAGGPSISTKRLPVASPIRIVYPGGNDALARAVGYGRRSGT
jgi:uncharacterized Zn-binding protein involved in type VI secretion